MNINLMTWYGNREMTYLPKHFVSTKTRWSDERHLWILEKCVGRFYVGFNDTGDYQVNIFFDDKVVYFEDPQEAVLYELTWS